MKKLMSLLLALSLLVCMGTAAFAKESESDGNSSAATAPDVSETIVESNAEEEINSAEEIDESETSETVDSVEEAETSESTVPEEEPDDSSKNEAGAETTATAGESAVPKDEPSAGESAGSQEQPETGAGNSTQSTDNIEPNESEGLSAVSPMAVEADTYSVTISWVGLSFTYNAAPKGKWDPESLSYGPSTGSPTWTSSDGEKGYGTFTVKCDKAESDLTVSFSYKSTATFGTRMKFSDTTEFSDSTINAKNVEFLSTEANVEKKLYVVPEVNTIAATAEAFAASQNKLGTITITIQASSWGDPASPEEPEIG